MVKVFSQAYPQNMLIEKAHYGMLAHSMSKTTKLCLTEWLNFKLQCWDEAKGGKL